MREPRGRSDMHAEEGEEEIFRYTVNDRLVQLRRRIGVAGALLVAFAIVTLSPLIDPVGYWIALPLLALVGAYTLNGITLYPRVRRFAEQFAIRLQRESLVIATPHDEYRIAYRELGIEDVTLGEDAVRNIRLVTDSGQAIDLNGLERMNELYASLQRRLAAADRAPA